MGGSAWWSRVARKPGGARPCADGSAVPAPSGVTARGKQPTKQPGSPPPPHFRQARRWEQRTPPSTPRVNMAVAALEGQLFVLVGGSGRCTKRTKRVGAPPFMCCKGRWLALMGAESAVAASGGRQLCWCVA